jgi:hypothetical protein
LHATLALNAPITLRSIAKARGKFVPHVPLIVKVLNAKGKKVDAATPLQTAHIPETPLVVNVP